VRRLVAAAGVAALVFPLAAAGRVSFTPTDPLVSKQYYLTQDHAFDAFPDVLPALNPVRVAIIDSGLDGTHPEFPARKLWPGGARSFVGGSALTDDQGHGTFIAGEIGAAINNNEGIAGIAFPTQLIIAKVARSDTPISVHDEAEAIRWAVNAGARVINLSLGGTRDPRNPRNDTYSPEEAAAIEYAARRGAVLVAAVGNSDNAPQTPWPWANYPAALPHVLGVSALNQSGNVPAFSDRDPIYNDISAPGMDIYSTLPLAITKQRSACPNQGYSDCGPDEFRHASGTSFAAPQATAAAALLLALRPTLKADQVTNILERSATDVNASDGCGECRLLRDERSGWGRLDIGKAIAALNGPLPPADRLEPNDDAGFHAPVLPARVRSIKATIDYWDDQIDVYRVRLNRGQRLRLTLEGPSGFTTNLLLWRPGTKRVNDLRRQNLRVAESIGPGASHRIAYRVAATGWYYVEVKLVSRGFGAYGLTIVRK
jgi:subtilisin family serine protease